MRQRVKFLKKFEQITVKVGDGALNLVEVLHGKLKDRADLIFYSLRSIWQGLKAGSSIMVPATVK